MTERKLTPKQEQARLQAASNCGDCKRIWDSFSDDFCDAHSVAGWQGLSPAKDASPEATKKSENGRPSKLVRRVRVGVIVGAVFGGLYWYGSTLEPEGEVGDDNKAAVATEFVETTVVDDTSWVPTGMTLVDGSDEVAFRYLSRTEMDCSTGGITCLGVEIVTKTDCRNLFAYLQWKDFGGYDVPFDSSTDSKGVPNHRAGARLQLVFQRSDPLGAITSGRIDSVDCL
jgi:hypothetical protein